MSDGSGAGRSTSQQERDLGWLLRVRGRDPRALEALYDAYCPLLHSVALHIVRVPAEAEEAVQEAWLQVWKGATSYDPARGTVAAWLLMIARSRSLDRQRSLASRKRAESRAETELDPAPVEDPAATPAHRQLHDRVRGALDGLTSHQRQVLELAYFHGLSQSEIAGRIGKPLGTVKSWTRQGLTRLRELLPAEEWA